MLFTVGNNLYITDADLSKLGGIVTASGENVVIGDTTVTGYATLADALAAQNCVMVVDVETSGAGQILINGKTVIGSDAIISDSTAANGGGLKTQGAVTLSGVSPITNPTRRLTSSKTPKLTFPPTFFSVYALSSSLLYHKF